MMPGAAKMGLPILGIVFLLVGVFKFLGGDGWVVWLILGVLFGGLGVFTRGRTGGGAS